METKIMKLSMIASMLLIGSNAIAGDNLIQNGSFENFKINRDHGRWKEVNFDNWSGRGEVWNHKLGAIARDGIYKAELDTSSHTLDNLTQTITTEEGKQYLFALDAYARKNGTSSFALYVDDNLVAEFTPNKYWNKYGVEFTGKGGEQTVSIREIESENDGLGAVIDNVLVLSDTTLDELKDQDRAKYEIVEPTGLDQILEIIDNDRVVHAKFTAEQINAAKDAADEMNRLISEAITVNGLANDGKITTSDAKEINRYLVEKYSDKWDDLRKAYYVIQNKTEVMALDHHAITTIWGKVYNLGYPATSNDRYTTNVKGNRSYAFTTVGYYLNTIAKNDMSDLNNSDFKEVEGTTGTNLDIIANVILNDRGLLARVPTSDLREGVRTANEMNKLIIEAIKVNGLANDGSISTADARTINNYLVTNYEAQWAELHGDDEDDAETGYHRVQNDGATTRMFGENVMNTIADGIYHLGYKTNHSRNLVNEDGNKNQTFEDVAWWLDISLKQDIQAGKFNNPNFKEVAGETGTALDKIITYIYNDEGLIANVSMEDIREGARTANEMNKLLVEAIKETGVATDGYISTTDAKTLNRYLVENHAAEWAELHGDDEDDAETGYHRIQNDGAVGVMEDRNTINNLADGIYHLGYETRYSDYLVNEDNNRNVKFLSVAYWLNKYLKDDIARGAFK
ncbi:MAG: hypothetical protein GXO60_04345 [Epsilonproteobacteria bacterium]|nr:hypothetical protein [Campylobacterota bacterium]